MSSPFTVGRRKKSRFRRSSIWVTDRLPIWEKQPNGRSTSQSCYTFFFRCKLWWWNFNSLIPQIFLGGSTNRIIIVNSWRYTKKKLVFVNFYRVLCNLSLFDKGPRNLASFLLEFASQIHHVFNSKCLTPQESGIRHSGTHFFCLHISSCVKRAHSQTSDFLRTDGTLEFFKKCWTIQPKWDMHWIYPPPRMQ